MAKQKVRKKTRAEKAHEGKREGRPSKYKAEYCEMLENHMEQGGSFFSFGALVRVGEHTLYDWLEVHEEFSQSKNIGELLSLKFHEDLGKAVMTGTLRQVVEDGTKPDGTKYKRYRPTRGDGRYLGIVMRSQFRKFGYANQLEVTGRGGGPIRTKDLADMTDEELAKEEEELKKQGY